MVVYNEFLFTFCPFNVKVFFGFVEVMIISRLPGELEDTVWTLIKVTRLKSSCAEPD